MIKVQNNVATREPIPAFLLGLSVDSLADLSWTDPSLGVQDCAWLPEVVQLPELGANERYGDETLTVGDGVVIVSRPVVPLTQEEIEAAAAAANAAKQARRDQINEQIAALQSELAALQ